MRSSSIRIESRRKFGTIFLFDEQDVRTDRVRLNTGEFGQNAPVLGWIGHRKEAVMVKSSAPKLLLAVIAVFASISELSASETCGATLTLLKSSFETGEQPLNAEVPPENTSLSLAVDYPPDGLTTAVPNVQVYGSLTGPANTGVAVNGRVVVNNATKYTSQLIPLTLGANTITVTASTQDGATQAVSRTVHYNPSAVNPVRFVGVTAADFAPLRIPFTLQATPPPGQSTIARVQIDFDGDATFDSDSASIPSNIAHDYAIPGVYLTRARVTFDDGDGMTLPVVHESTFRIQMHQLAYTREVLCTVYYAMKHRLQANDIASALNTIATDRRSQYQAMWTAAGGNLPTIATGLGDIALGRIADISAELTMAVPDDANPGEYLGFPVLLARDATGVWRITGM